MEIVEFVHNFLVEAQAKRQISHLASNTSISRQTLTKFIANKDALSSSNLLDRLYEKAIQGQSGPLTSAIGKTYAAIALLFGVDETQKTRLRKYEGIYDCYRINKESNGLIDGKIEIKYSLEHKAFLHHHKSTQEIHGILRRFDHLGPVYIFDTRLYLIGIGTSENGSRYLRPMIMRAVDEPGQEILMGVVLTETASKPAPMASKVAFRNMRMGPTKQDEKSEILELLKNEAGSAHILYGWSS